MNAPAGLERQVTEWLRSEATAEGMDLVLVASLSRAAQVRQERSQTTYSLPGVRRHFRPLIVAAAVAAAVMVVAVSSIPPLPKAASAVVTGVWPTGPEVVFTAVLPPDAPSGIYWRGAIYDSWSARDRGWRVSDPTFTSVAADTSISEVVGDEMPADSASAISVTVVPGEGTPFVVAPGIPVSVDQAADIETSGPGGPLVQVSLSGPAASYRVTAIPTAPHSTNAEAERLAEAGSDYPADIRSRYAIAPDPAEFGPESTAFMEAIRDTVGDDPYKVAAAIVEAFQSPRFTYVVDTRDVDCGADGFTECFLRVKRGYCMYFATAMVMLLRHEGIPARFVEGFLPGEREGSHVTVRTHEAHAWVEVFFPGSGWVTFDPTPSPPPTVTPALDRPKNH
jgi:transglutaminase-like putative cysteine protease